MVVAGNGPGSAGSVVGSNTSCAVTPHEASSTRHYLWIIEEKLSFETSSRRLSEEADYRLFIQASCNNFQQPSPNMFISILMDINFLQDHQNLLMDCLLSFLLCV